MADGFPQHHSDRTQLQQIIVGLTEGIITINSDQTIAWANEATLAMHGVRSAGELGSTVSEYRDKFELHHRNHHKLPAGDYPMDRVVSGGPSRKSSSKSAATGPTCAGSTRSAAWC